MKRIITLLFFCVMLFALFADTISYHYLFYNPYVDPPDTFSVPYICFKDSSLYIHLDSILDLQNKYTSDRSSGRRGVLKCNVIDVVSRKLNTDAKEHNVPYYWHITECNYVSKKISIYDAFEDAFDNINSPYYTIRGFFRYKDYIFTWYGDVLDNMIITDNKHKFYHYRADLSNIEWYEYDFIFVYNSYNQELRQTADYNEPLHSLLLIRYREPE